MIDVLVTGIPDCNQLFLFPVHSGDLGLTLDGAYETIVSNVSFNLLHLYNYITTFTSNQKSEFNGQDEPVLK